MKRPPLEVATVVRAVRDRFVQKNRAWLQWSHLKVMGAIARCRTAELGGHRDECPSCGHRAISYNSCRNRHCTKCQSASRQRWLENRKTELLPTGYFHVVFTLPHALSTLALQNKRRIYDLLFRASAEALLEVAANPRHLGAHVGFLGVLHSWGQNLLHHPHIHYVIPAGGLSPDRSRWLHSRPNFFLPKYVLRRVFRGKFVDGLESLFLQHKLTLTGSLQLMANNEKVFRSFLRAIHRHHWVVYLKPPFGGPDHVLRYLARYTHRVAISNHRLLRFENNQVTFRWRDYAHGNKKRIMTLSAEEFLRRFLLHVLPTSFVRIRFFGFLANCRRAELLPLCRGLLQQVKPLASTKPAPAEHPLFRCPRCSTPMVIIERLTALALHLAANRSVPVDSS